MSNSNLKEEGRERGEGKEEKEREGGKEGGKEREERKGQCSLEIGMMGKRQGVPRQMSAVLFHCKLTSLQ